MLNLRFTPNPKWPAWAAARQAQSSLTYLQNQADTSFTLVIDGQSYDLSYKIEGELATIFCHTVGSTVTPMLQLNIGSWLLPVAESMELPDNPGLNPGVSQDLCREIYEGALPPQVTMAIMAKIQEVGLFRLIFQKNHAQ